MFEIDRPEAPNALKLEVREQLACPVETFAADDAVRFIAITRHGANFAAGADINAFEKVGSADMLAQHARRYWGNAADKREGVAALLEKRKPIFKGL